MRQNIPNIVIKSFFLNGSLLKQLFLKVLPRGEALDTSYWNLPRGKGSFFSFFKDPRYSDGTKYDPSHPYVPDSDQRLEPDALMRDKRAGVQGFC